jgi:uncharacterized membrane protein YoaT (DUF817 family)
VTGLREIYNLYFKYFSVWRTFDDMRLHKIVVCDFYGGISYASLGSYLQRADTNAKETHKNTKNTFKKYVLDYF